ncbi:hypothetical protein AFI02nite_04860 [Aliivibrio fischeri]|uniref:Uncharacterized protein n=2 Tax=Aliivibrio fischeri TaxID=668 RepID=A0A510UGA8_ALIFS|nr:hypothetical protein VFMJ11_1223 [Aliivibrio fischeri MJ11]GEK12450.1 hypothetical protein AFI02nite_04860 [Aliivibrio fischeri]
MVIRIFIVLCFVIVLSAFMYDIHLLGMEKRTAILDSWLEQNKDVK